MAQRRYHYERAFEQYLRTRRIPYISVDEARRALLPFEAERSGNAASARRAESDDDNGGGGIGGPLRVARDPTSAEAGFDVLKAFDFVIYGSTTNLLIEVKGRRVGSAAISKRGGEGVLKTGRLESWATEDDIASLSRWRQLFNDGRKNPTGSGKGGPVGGRGGGFDAALVFIYWCDAQPPDALFQEVFEYRGVWYALRAVNLDDYTAAMKPRSLRWRTVHVPTAEFQQISRPFVQMPDDLPLQDIDPRRAPGAKTTLIHIPDPPMLGGDSGGLNEQDGVGVFSPLAGSIGRH